MNSAWKFAILACVLVGAVLADQHHEDDAAVASALTDGESALACAAECPGLQNMPTSPDEFTKEDCDKVKEYVECLDTKEVCKTDSSAANTKESLTETIKKCEEKVGEGSGSSIAQASVLLTAVAALFARW